MRIVFFFILFISSTSCPMMRRAMPPARGKTPAVHQRPQLIIKRTYCTDNALNLLQKKVKEYRVMEQMHLDEYEIWERVTLDCLAKGSCLTGKCVPKSNCLVNAQAAHLAWQTAQKETFAHEMALRLLVYEKTFPLKTKVKK